jgi:hypothetical protein
MMCQYHPAYTPSLPSRVISSWNETAYGETNRVFRSLSSPIRPATDTAVLRTFSYIAQACSRSSCGQKDVATVSATWSVQYDDDALIAAQLDGPTHRLIGAIEMG